MVVVGREFKIYDEHENEQMCSLLCSYCQAQVAAKQAVEKLSQLGLPTERPDDYFAEMIKTDAHMHKVWFHVPEKD